MDSRLLWLAVGAHGVFPLGLDQYPPPAGSLIETLAMRARFSPFNLAATAIFVLAVLHTFAAQRFRALAHDLQERHAQRGRAAGLEPEPSVAAEILHFFGEVEVIFGLWALALVGAIAFFFDWDTAKHYLNDTVNYTEPLFVVVIMALAATRPVLTLAERLMGTVARRGGGRPAAWWFAILTVG
ncbi:MAG TPA: putative Na+/H+ antiporter, partial [Vicinamibacteria bacterium]